MTKEEEWLLKNPYGLILDVDENGEITGVKIDPEVPAEDRFAYIMDRHTSGKSRENWEKIKAEIDAKRKEKYQMQRSIINDIKYNYDHRPANQEKMNFEEYEAFCIADLTKDLIGRTGHGLEESVEMYRNEQEI